MDVNIPRGFGAGVSELVGHELDVGSFVDEDARERVTAGVWCRSFDAGIRGRVRKRPEKLRVPKVLPTPLPTVKSLSAEMARPCVSSAPRASSFIVITSQRPAANAQAASPPSSARSAPLLARGKRGVSNGIGSASVSQQANDSEGRYGLCRSDPSASEAAHLVNRSRWAARPTGSGCSRDGWREAAGSGVRFGWPGRARGRRSASRSRYRAGAQ
jgi:hypothetical protein